MPRLSLWKPEKSNDYKFIDKNIRGMYDAGGTGILLHKYLGPNTQGTQLVTTTPQLALSPILNFASTSQINLGDFVYGNGIPAGSTVVSKDISTITLSNATTVLIPAGASIGFSSDATQPAFPTTSTTSIQDMLFLENRDRKYDTSIYSMRGIYTKTDQDFDLSQFGLFLQNGTIMMTFHYNDMMEMLGRKIMGGDVIELLHLKDYDPLDPAGTIDSALKRFYVAGDASFAASGFSATWWPHLWRVKFDPLVDSQEYKDILNTLQSQTGLPGGITPTPSPLADIISTYQQYANINQAVVTQAQSDVPLSGYDTTAIYSPQVDAAGNVVNDTDNGLGQYNPSPNQNPTGYLTGDGVTPDGIPMGAGIAFPPAPAIGDYYLRLDYLPNRLFRFSGARWVKMEDNVRTNLTNGAPNNLTQRSGFVNDSSTITLSNGDVVPTLQNLNQALKPTADY